jgi:hypothetical protein
MTLFPTDKIVGTFYGFAEGGMSPTAELVFRHNDTFQSSPVSGMPVLVRLEGEDEALLVRITRLVPAGRLASSIGEEYALRNVRDQHFHMPENVLDSFLSYRVQARPLGLLRRVGGKTIFVASHRRIPPFGSPVAFPDDDLFRIVMCAGPDDSGVEIGYAALGEFVWGSGDSRFTAQEWMQPQRPVTMPKFDIRHLIARRSFVLAKAGYGKSNLVKFLFSELYRETPLYPRQNGGDVPVGTLIGDLDGEYFWPDNKGTPGLADIPHLRDKLVVFTDKTPPSAAYNSFTAGRVRLDIRDLSPTKVLSLTLSQDRLNQTNVTKIMALKPDQWADLVNAVDPANGKSYADSMAAIADILNLKVDKDEVQLGAARHNVGQAISKLHDADSQTLPLLLEALRAGKLCVLDLSGLRGSAQSFLGLILDHIFHWNMKEHTAAESKAIPVIGVIEEAQNVLSKTGGPGTKPFVEFTKEGRKFDCSVLAITQQPGSIDDEIISQGDNFFAFHLLSESDLKALKRSNAHFADDILASLLNEPLVGSGYFWSGHSDKKYPVPFRPFDLRGLYGQTLLDPLRTGDPVDTYVTTHLAAVGQRIRDQKSTGSAALDAVVQGVRHDATFQAGVRGAGLRWGQIKDIIARYAEIDVLPQEQQGAPDLDKALDDWSHANLPLVLNAVLGQQYKCWKYDRTGTRMITVLAGATPAPTEDGAPPPSEPTPATDPWATPADDPWAGMPWEPQEPTDEPDF